MDKIKIEKLHQQLLTAWNQQDAKGMASLFADDGNVVGFDGSQMDGRINIESELSGIFADHIPASYVWKVRGVRFLSEDIALLRAVVGMVPPGKKEINPASNAIQSLIATRKSNEWKIALFQNTPAQFHGRTGLSEKLTKELNELV